MILRKSKAPRKSPEKWTFLSLAFYNAPSLHTVNESLPGISGVPKRRKILVFWVVFLAFSRKKSKERKIMVSPKIDLK